MSSIKPATSTSEPKPVPEYTAATPANCCRHCQKCNPAPMLSMNTLKTTLWYIAIGFGAAGLSHYLGVNASPMFDVSEPVARDVSPSMDLFYKGEHFDNGTGYSFDLYTIDDLLDEDAAFADYMAAYIDGDTGDNSTNLQKRDWYDCQHLGNGFQTLGCNTGHALGKFIQLSGATAFGNYIYGAVKEAFSDGRDDKNPRSICVSRDKNNLCISWASYTGSGLPSKDANTITDFSTKCAQSDGSAEFKTTMSDGGTLFICVSDRADGCSKSVC